MIAIIVELRLDAKFIYLKTWYCQLFQMKTEKKMYLEFLWNW